MGQSSGRIKSEGGSSSKTLSKRPSVQSDVNGDGSIVPPGTPNYKHPEGRFDSATPTRWDSRENLIDTQSDDCDPQLFLVKHDFTAQGDGQLTVRRGEKVKVMEFSDEGDWVEGTNSRGIVGWLPASYIMQCDSLEKFSWYHGNITRAAAEVALSSGINGSFLIRESESKPGQYSISLRFNGRMYHYRISQDPVTKKYFVMQDIKFPTLKELVHYHSQQADGLVCTLHYPAPNPKTPTIFGLSQADEWEINRSKIEMGQKLGGGQYGEVYKGTYLKTGQSVAVKTFREETTDANEFLKEAAVMKKVRHAHLVQLLGVCTRELPFFIVTEYMPKGNLLDYIRGPEGRNLDAVTLVYMSQQIASAMAYLEEKGFIHRDLAARNCLVGNGYLVKVADFGLSRFVENDVYDARSGTKFPIKWTAPEALAYNQFSIKSDIWAFGILLWELATQGMSPYPGVELAAVYELLEKGYRLECPEGCPSNIYDMMKRCWEWTPQKRPQFAELHEELNAMSNVNEEVEKALEPQNNIQTRPLPPTPAKSHSPTHFESRPPPALPGAKGTQPPRVEDRSKSRGAPRRPQPPGVPVQSQPQQQPTAPRLPQRPLSPPPDSRPPPPAPPTAGGQRSITTPKGSRPPPPGKRRTGPSYTKTPSPPPVLPKEELHKSATMSSAQGQSSPWWRDRTTHDEEPSKPAPRPKPGRPFIPNKPTLPTKPSLASRKSPPVVTPKSKQTQGQKWQTRGCSSAADVQELTKDIMEHIGEVEQVQESRDPLNATLSSIVDMCEVLLSAATEMADSVSSSMIVRRSCTVLRDKLATLKDLSSVLKGDQPNPAQTKKLEHCLQTLGSKCEEICTHLIN